MAGVSHDLSPCVLRITYAPLPAPPPSPLSPSKNTAPNEVEEEIKHLKDNAGFAGYMIVNNDGRK
jgi:hypothetical protein